MPAPAHRVQSPGLEDFQTERYEVRAIADERPDYGVTSIVIVTYNQLGCTRACLDSIRFVTDEPYELIVVDNGSTDGTVEYLRSCPDVKLIENPDNRGFPAAANQGIRASNGAQVLLLNNDVLVTTGWLRRMLDALEGSGFSGQGSAEKSDARSQESEPGDNPKSKIQNPPSAWLVRSPTRQADIRKSPLATLTSPVSMASPGNMQRGTPRKRWKSNG